MDFAEKYQIPDSEGLEKGNLVRWDQNQSIGLDGKKWAWKRSEKQLNK